MPQCPSSRTTYPTSPNSTGRCYRVGITDNSSLATPNQTKAVVEGQIFKCILEGDKVVVKIYHAKNISSEKICQMVIQKSSVLKNELRNFMNHQNASLPVEVISPDMVRLSNTTTWLHEFAGLRRKEEMMIAEEYLGPYFEVFIDRGGYVNNQTTFWTQFLEEMVHFTSHHSNGQMVISGLQGMIRNSTLFLSEVTIHSNSSCYGNGDGGVAGIERVMNNNHVCTDTCREWLRPEPDTRQRLVPTALPPEKSYHGHHPSEPVATAPPERHHGILSHHAFHDEMLRLRNLSLSVRFLGFDVGYIGPFLQKKFHADPPPP